jgi:hypothetical protein
MLSPTGVEVAAMKDCGQHTWQEIGDHFGVTMQTARARYLRRDREARVGPCPSCMNLNNGRASFKVENNYAEAMAIGAHSLEELLDTCDVDLNVWRVLDWGYKEWQVGAKVKEGHLEWVDGKMNGYLDYLGLKKEDLESTWAKFVRVEPIAFSPVLQPVHCDFAYREPSAPKEPGIKSSLLVADPQAGFSREISSAELEPFHDRAVLDIALQLVALLQPDRVDILGDIFDFVNWTDRFLRSPKYEYTTQPAILELHWWLRQFREASPGSDIRVHAGNHDDRMRKSIMKHLRHAYGLRAADEMHLPPALSPERLLALHELGIEWIGDYPNDVDWINDDLMLYHGETTSQRFSGMANTLFRKYGVSVIFAHNHRSELARRTIYYRGGSKVLTAYSPGCACRTDGTVPARTKRENWQKGLGIVWYTEDRFDIQDLVVKDRSVIYGNQLIEARDRLEDLREAWPEWNW